MSEVIPNPEAVTEALKRIFSPGDVFEIRALETTRPGLRRPHVESGYFDYAHIDEVGTAIKELSFAKGVYYTPNPVLPSLLARAANRIRAVGMEPTTKDDEIVCRRWLLVDCDPVRPAGISSTDEEHELAHMRARDLRDGLSSMGWPQPIYCDSGNGAQLLYRIDLPRDDAGLVKRVLEVLATTDDDKVKVDQSVSNPARIWRLPGTMNCRGDHIPDRPHRLAQVIDLPDALTIVTREQLEEVTGRMASGSSSGHGTSYADVDISKIAGPAPFARDSFDLDRWISEHCPEAEGPTDWQGGLKWIFPVCPFNESHTNRSAVLIQQPTGAIAFRCHHNGCRDFGWKELRDLKEPGRTAPKQPDPVIKPLHVDVETEPTDAAAQPLSTLFETVTDLDPPLIHGLLREGETMNVIASSKMGKSWLVMRLAISIASGLDWFGMLVEHGRVLHIDNELRLKTIVYRYRKVAEALKVPYHLFSHNLEVKTLRGRLQDLNALGAFFKTIEPGRYKVIIIDAFYRTLPADTDENDNGAIARLYNQLDNYASRLQCAFILIHHSSKGSQAQKSITDVGAGAGAQSRAADTHLILRPHEMPNVAVLEAAVRSWPPRTPICLRWEFPLWHPAGDLDPAALQGMQQTAKHSRHTWSLEEFIAKCVLPVDPCAQKKVLYEAEQLGLSERKARSLIDLAQNEGLLAKEQDGSNQHLVAVRPGISGGKAQLIAAYLENRPDLGAQELADQFQVSKRYVLQIKSILQGGELESENE